MIIMASKKTQPPDHLLLWPLSHLDVALQFVATAAFKVSGDCQLPKHPHTADASLASDWLESATDALGVNAEPLMVHYAKIDDLLQRGAPLLFGIKKENQIYACFVLRARNNALSILGTDFQTYQVPRAWLRSHYCHTLENELGHEIDEVLDMTPLKDRKKQKAREVLLRERFGDRWLGHCWLLRQPMRESLWKHIKKLSLHWRFLALMVLHFGYYVLWLFSWWLIGKSLLSGRVEFSLFVAWALTLVSLIPLRLLIRWLQGVLSVRVGSLLKQKLCHGALQLDPDDLRQQGVGGLLGKVIESEQLETLSINGGFVGFLALVEFIMAAFVLSLGLGNGIMLLALLVWLMVTFLVGWKYYQRRSLWSAQRLAMTHHLVERMIGHRTRRLQQPPSLWHEEEDQELSRYIQASKRLDALSAWMVAGIPRGWIVLALLFLAPLLIQGVVTAALAAVTIGGMLLAFRAFQKLVLSVNNLAGAVIAWHYISELVHASDHMQKDGAVDLYSNFSNDQTSDTVLTLRHIDFQYRSRGQNVLSQANLDIQKGDLILLQGPSGGGKSTLVSLLSALRKPTSGLMFLKGLDVTTWGARRWRKHVAAAPQFHENRVLSATFAFNLLMGRDWPPTPDDLQEAENICNELGLDKLLGEMPAGMMQMVGETGWQLSHGEKSRLYVARALLQKAPLVILDESFAALDSETIAKVHNTIHRRADSLIVVAHP